MKREVREDQGWGRLGEMREKLEEIERLVFDLKESGKGIPVIEKNACSIPSFVYVLRLGISDVAEITDTRRN